MLWPVRSNALVKQEAPVTEREMTLLGLARQSIPLVQEPRAMSDDPQTPDPRQTRYEQQRAEWQRDVWAALEERRQQAAAMAQKEKQG